MEGKVRFTMMGRNWLLRLVSLFIIFTLFFWIVFATAPTHSKPLLNSSSSLFVTSDNLTCFNQSASDSESDLISFNYQFYKNGILNASRAIHDKHLIFWYPMDHNESEFLTDFSTHQNNATIFGANFIRSNFNNGYKFSFAESDYIRARKTLSHLSENFTLTVLFNFSDSPLEAGIITKDSSPSISLTTNTANCNIAECEDFIFIVRDSGDTQRRINFSFEDNKGKLTFLALTYNSSILKAYVNGVLKGNLSFTTGILQSSTDFFLGAFEGAPATAFLNGTIFEASFRNASSTDEEIMQIHLALKNKVGTYNSSDTNVDDTFICEATPYDFSVSGTPLNSSPHVIQSDVCLPPFADNWNITDDTNCYVNSSITIPANLNISLGSLEIREAGSITISGNFIFINSSSNITMLPGGQING